MERNEKEYMCAHDHVFINVHRVVLLAEEEASPSLLTCLGYKDLLAGSSLGNPFAIARAHWIPLHSPCANHQHLTFSHRLHHHDRGCSEPLGLGRPLGASLTICCGQTSLGLYSRVILTALVSPHRWSSWCNLHS